MYMTAQSLNTNQITSDFIAQEVRHHLVLPLSDAKCLPLFSSCVQTTIATQARAPVVSEACLWFQVISYLKPLLQLIGDGAKLIPEVGSIISAVDAFAKAGLDIASAATQTNIPFQSGDQFATLAAGECIASVQLGIYFLITTAIKQSSHLPCE